MMDKKRLSLLKECKTLHNLFEDNLNIPVNNPLLEAIYTALLIRLHDMLTLLEEERESIALTFSDNVEIDPQNDVKDIFDLVRIHRNVACHTASDLKKLKDTNIIFSFNIIIGKNPRAVKIHSKYYGNDYKDDVAIYYDHLRIYFKRHIAGLLNFIERL